MEDGMVTIVGIASRASSYGVVDDPCKPLHPLPPLVLEPKC